jgi:hypothetical protein
MSYTTWHYYIYDKFARIPGLHLIFARAVLFQKIKIKMSDDDDWDVEDDAPVIAPAVKSKWAEEDEQDVKVFVSFDKKDAWDADSEEEKVVEKVVEKKASPPVKKKSALKQKLEFLKQKEEEKASQKQVTAMVY